MLKTGMLVKAKRKLTICPEEDEVRDYLDESQIGIVVNVVENCFKTHITLLCKSEIKNFGLRKITIPYSYSMSTSENISRYFLKIND